jgi:hypothetical protein
MVVTRNLSGEIIKEEKVEAEEKKKVLSTKDLFKSTDPMSHQVTLPEEELFENFFQHFEEGNDLAWYESMFAGIASGVIKIPEGAISLGAEIYDATNDTRTAAEVEKWFADFNPFDEAAEDKAIGKITEVLTLYGIPFGIGFKVARAMIAPALKAKRAGVYANLKSKNVKEGVRLAQREFIKNQKKYNVGAGLIGGMAGEAIVASDSSLRKTGSLFQDKIPGTQIDYPLAYEPEKVYGEEPSGSEEATRRLMNRMKWGAEGGLFIGALNAVGKGAKLLYKRGKNLQDSNSAILRSLDAVAQWFRPRGKTSPEYFSDFRKFKGSKTAKENLANQIMLDFDKSLNKIYPAVSRVLNASTRKERETVYKDLNDLMKTMKDGNFNSEIVARVTDTLKQRGGTEKQIKEVLGHVAQMREFLDSYLRKIGASPSWGDKLTGPAADLWLKIQNGMGTFLESTYDFMKPGGVGIFDRLTSSSELITRAMKLLKRHARMKGYDMTDLEAQSILKNMINAGSRTLTKETLEAKNAMWSLNKFDFGSNAMDPLRQLTDNLYAGVKEKRELTPLFKELFGEVTDPRMNFLETGMKLISTMETDKLYRGLLDKSTNTFKRGLIRNAEGKITGFQGKKPMIIPESELAALNLSPEAAKSFLKQIYPNQEVRRLDFTQGSKMGESYLTNPLKGSYAPKGIAQTLEAYHMPTWSEDPAKALIWNTFRTFFLMPKAAVNIAKTVLGPFTHARNWVSASAFSLANGNMFGNPKNIARHLNEALSTTQGPFKSFNSKGAQERYRRLLELGVVNSNVRLGDILRLVDDIGAAGGPLSYTATKEPLKAYQKLLKKVQDAYVAEDDYWKIFNFAQERAKLKRKFPKHTDDMLDEEAADIVRNTVPNYEYVGLLQRGLRWSPLGNFVSFPSEMIRTSFNIAERGIKEIVRGTRTGNGGDIRDGIGRLVGLGGVGILGGEALVWTGQTMFDVGDKKVEAIRRFVAPWAKNSPLMPTGQDENGNYKFIDLGNILAYETVVEPARAILLEVAQGETNEDRLMETLRKGLFRATADILEPFISESIWAAALVDVSPVMGRGGETKEGKQIYNPEDTTTNKFIASMEHVITDVLPLNASQLTRIFKAFNETPLPGGETYELENELFGIAGMRQQIINPQKQLPYKITDYRNARDSSRRKTNLIAYREDPATLTPINLINGYREQLRILFKAQQELYRDVKASRELGMLEEEIRSTLAGRDLGTAAINNIMEGRFYPERIAKGARKEMFFNEAEKNLPNPYPEAEGALDALFDYNVDKSLETGEIDYLYRLTAPKPRVPTAGQVVGNQTLAQNYTSPGIVLPPQGQNQYNPATGLSRTETALLSPSDQLIRKQQRGIV